MSPTPASPAPQDTDTTRCLAQAQARTRAGDPVGARALLQQAAQAGHPQALLQLGVWDLIGLGAPVNVPAAVARLSDAAERGHPPAMSLRAQLIAAGAADLPPDFAQVKSWLLRAAQAGDPRAVVQLAILVPDRPEHAAVRAALLQTAAKVGEPTARKLLERLPGSAASHQDAAVDWDEVAVCVAWPHERELPAAQIHSPEPRIVARPGLLTADECLYVSLKGQPLLRPARVVGRDGASTVDAIRSNETAKFGLLEADAVIQSLDRRIAAALGHPAANGEGLALLRYQVGQQYLPHCDWIDPQREATRADLDRWGQRVATCVVYLNDGFEGGTTAFPELGLEFRGAPGDAFQWDNVRPDGAIDPRTLHAGRPPTQGVKLLLSKWMRDRSQKGNEA